MNMFKSNGGFTLVELIIVIAILAILAGVAVPAYSGYLKSAEKAAEIPTLDAIKTACQAATATSGTAITKIEVITNSNGAVTSVEVNDVAIYSSTANPAINADFNSFIDLEGETFKYYKNGATWSNGEWIEGATAGA